MPWIRRCPVCGTYFEGAVCPKCGWCAGQVANHLHCGNLFCASNLIISVVEILLKSHFSYHTTLHIVALLGDCNGVGWVLALRCTFDELSHFGTFPQVINANPQVINRRLPIFWANLQQFAEKILDQKSAKKPIKMVALRLQPDFLPPYPIALVKCKKLQQAKMPIKLRRVCLSTYPLQL